MIYATDSEWDTNLPQPWLSTVLVNELTKVLYVRNDLDLVIKNRMISVEKELGVEIVFTEKTDGTKFLEDDEHFLTMFFSPKDVEYCLGWDAEREAIEGGTIRQRNNVSGKVGKIKIRDLCGLAGKSGLKKFADNLGLPMEQKGLMDDYKTCMMKGLIAHPEDFVRYAVEDGTILLKLYKRCTDMVRCLQSECLEMGEEYLWKQENMPMTAGSLVARTFQGWLTSRCGDKAKAFLFCLNKLGVLDPDDRRYKQSNFLFQNIHMYRKPEDLVGENYDFIMKESEFICTGLDSASVNWWANRSIDDSSCLNALVHGGRCNNENPYEYAMDAGLDIDISSCYGDSLRTLTYPIGVPSVWRFAPNDKVVTFGEWYDKNSENLVDGLWSAVVSGDLGFEQDLIFSKLVRREQIKKVLGDGDEDGTDIPASTVLLRRSVKNGIINGDIIRTLRSVATAREWSDCRRLRLDTAAAYLRSDRIDSLDDWISEVMAWQPPPKKRHDVNADERIHCWFGIPLEEFIGKVIDHRKRFKKMSQDKTLSLEEAKGTKGKSEIYKLFICTFYGAMASRYFEIGNTVLANNITAKARVGVWMVAKSLGLRQCITDGGIYSPEYVRFFKGKLPGLQYLARTWDWENAHLGRWCGKIGEWKDDDGMNALALAHVQNFWMPYGLKLPFELEHKTENRFLKAAYGSKGDYALLRLDGEVYFKMRGKEQSKDEGFIPHPTFELFRNMIDGSDEFPQDLRFTRKSILKIGKWKMAQSSKGFEVEKTLRPGDSVPMKTSVARYNNGYFPINDEVEYLRRKKRTGKQDRVLFEKYRESGIAFVHQKMRVNDLYTAPQKNGISGEAVYQDLPYLPSDSDEEYHTRGMSNAPS